MSILKNVDIHLIELDFNNPRIAQFAEMYGDKIDAQKISFALRRGIADGEEDNSTTTFRSLKESIRTNKGLINPIILNKKNNKYTVIEGNTRLAIYKEFYESTKNKTWAQIPSLIHNDMDSKQIDGIRLQAHLVGVRPWDPYSKAKYLCKLRNENHLTWNEIVDYCGGKKEEAERYINAYEDMENFYRPVVDDSDFDTTRFSGFVELQKSRIKESLYRHNYDETDFSKWIRDSLIFPLNTVRIIPAILDHSEAHKIFLKKGAKEARKTLNTIKEDLDVTKLDIIDLAYALTEKLRIIPKERLSEYGDGLNEEYNALKTLEDELIDTFEYVKKS